jgi:AraC-like DNA-binding protein
MTKMMRSSKLAPHNITTSAVGNIARLAYTLALRKSADVDRLLRNASLSRAQMNNPSTRVQAKDQIKFLNLVAETIDDNLLGFHLSLHFDLRKVGLANRHLTDKELSISQIAWLLGYQSISAFTNAYKRWTGDTPRMARRRVR